MAIVNTFRKCLETPYLFEDPEAPGRIGALLTMAGERLDAAGTLQASALPADQADSSLLSYEAMFAALRALVYAKGYREAGLRCLLLACEELYVRPDQLDPSHLIAFERAQGLKATPADNLAAARAFVQRARELLASPAGVSA